MEDLKQIQEFFSKPLEEVTKSQMLKKAKKGSYPATLVAIENGKVVAQEKVSTPQEAPAAHSVMSKKYPNANIRLEDSTGKILEENSRLRKQFILLEPAEIKYTKSFGTGIKAPGVLHQANEGVFLGAEDAYIIVLPGGTFYVDEDAETAIPIWPLKDQPQALHKVLHSTPFTPEFKVWKDWIKRPNVLDEDASIELKPVGRDTGVKLNIRAIKKHLEGKGYTVRYQKGSSMLNPQGIDVFNPELGSTLTIARNGELFGDGNWGVEVSSEKEAIQALKQFEKELNEYNTGIYYNPTRERNAPKAKEASKVGIEKLKDMIKKIMKEDLADFEEKDANYDELYSDYLYKMVKEVAAQKGFSKYLKSKDNPKGETEKFDSKTLNKILMNVIKDLDETIKLGKTLDESTLCKRGQDYIKARKAAGEKSSAYLSGRAVRVCKGDIKFKGKKQKDFKG